MQSFVGLGRAGPGRAGKRKARPDKTEDLESKSKLDLVSLPLVKGKKRNAFAL